MFSFRVIAAVFLATILCAAKEPSGHSQLPYRFLLVISDQWKDPASYIIEEGSEFQILAALLKTWGLPFEILRLDQQRFDAYHLLDREGRPRCGTIIWDASFALSQSKDVKFVQELVRNYGVNLVVLGDAVGIPEISDLTGLRYVSDYISRDGLAAPSQHFIARVMQDEEKEFPTEGRFVQGTKVSVNEATVLMSREGHPFLSVREINGGGRVVWLDAHRSSAFIKEQRERDLFKRCLVWAQGYALYVEYPKSIILFMDDMGTSEKTYLPYWHYRSLTEEEIRSGLIEPLKRYNAVLVQNVNTGFVDRKTRRILNPWKQNHVIDEIDGKSVHDYSSTKRGLDAGLREGVFEIQSHGWTHMLPDLDSPPGPWWTAPMDGVGSLSWYHEFHDGLRNQEVPAATQKLHLRRAIETIQTDFAVTPLFVNPGGGGKGGVSYAHNSERIAAELGFGLSKFGPPAYLGRDFVISLDSIVPRGGWGFNRKLTGADIPWTADAPYFLTFHDRDVAMDRDSVARLLKDLGEGVHYMTANEYGGYLHAKTERDTEAASTLSLAVEYDSHYCRYFESHKSRWTLHLSDETRRVLGKALPEKQNIEIPAGLGRHVVSVRSSKPS